MSPEQREATILAYWPAVRKVADSLIATGAAACYRDDLVSVGTLAMIRVIDSAVELRGSLSDRIRMNARRDMVRYLRRECRYKAIGLPGVGSDEEGDLEEGGDE